MCIRDRHKYDICLTTDDVIGLMWQMLGKESCEYLPPLQGVLDLLDDLYEQDIQIDGISNTVLPENLLNPILSRHNMKKYFRRIVLSSECGYRKHSDEFFEITWYAPLSSVSYTTHPLDVYKRHVLVFQA